MKRLAYPLSVCVFSLGALCFYLLFIGPKIEYMFRDTGGRSYFVRERWFDLTLRFGAEGYFWCWVPILLTVLLTLGAFLPVIPGRIRFWMGGVLVGWSWVVFLSTLWCLGVGTLGGAQAGLAYAFKISAYERVLQEQSLLELAQNRHSKTVEYMERMQNIRPVETPVEQLTPKERRSRISFLIRLMKDNQSPEMKKRMLASLWPLRTEIKEGTEEAEKVLKFAKEGTGVAFSELEDFFTWLEPRLGREGWDPVPAYRLVAPGDKP